jgi:hypothetical protein
MEQTAKMTKNTQTIFETSEMITYDIYHRKIYS